MAKTQSKAEIEAEAPQIAVPEEGVSVPMTVEQQAEALRLLGLTLEMLEAYGSEPLQFAIGKFVTGSGYGEEE